MDLCMSVLILCPFIIMQLLATRELNHDDAFTLEVVSYVTLCKDSYNGIALQLDCVHAWPFIMYKDSCNGRQCSVTICVCMFVAQSMNNCFVCKSRGVLAQNLFILNLHERSSTFYRLENATTYKLLVYLLRNLKRTLQCRLIFTTDDIVAKSICNNSVCRYSHTVSACMQVDEDLVTNFNHVAGIMSALTTQLKEVQRCRKVNVAHCSK